MVFAVSELARKYENVVGVTAAMPSGTGINKTTLHKLYNGELTRIDLDTIDRICEHLDIQVGDLFVFEKIINNHGVE